MKMSVFASVVTSLLTHVLQFPPINSGDQHGYLLPDTVLDDGKLLKYITQNHSQVRVVLVSSRAKPLSGRPRSAG